MQPDWQRQINQILGATYDWEIFAKGSSNTLYRGQLEGEQVVLRRNGPVSATPGVNREREALLLNLITPYKWSPDIIENRVSEDWCLMRCYSPLTNKYALKHSLEDENHHTHSAQDNNSLESTNKLSSPQQNQLIAAISDLQNTSLETTLTTDEKSLLTINYQQLWDTVYLPLAQARNDRVIIEWIDTIKHQLKTLPTLSSCLVHHDLHIGNLALETPEIGSKHEQLILLDWEYGGIGNAWFDAAAMVRFLNIPNEMIFNLPCFKHLTKPCFQAGLKQAIELSELINKLWYRARSET